MKNVGKLSLLMLYLLMIKVQPRYRFSSAAQCYELCFVDKNLIKLRSWTEETDLNILSLMILNYRFWGIKIAESAYCVYKLY